MLCTQSSNESSELKTNTQNVNGKLEPSTEIPAVVDNVQCEHRIEPTAQCIEEAKVLSLKCLALKAIQDSQCH